MVQSAQEGWEKSRIGRRSKKGKKHLFVERYIVGGKEKSFHRVERDTKKSVASVSYKKIGLEGRCGGNTKSYLPEKKPYSEKRNLQQILKKTDFLADTGIIICKPEEPLGASKRQRKLSGHP